MTDGEIMKIELGKLVANTYNPRKRMGDKHLASLKKSLKEDGQLQNLLVRPIAGGKHEVVAGMRRFLSMKKIYDDKFKVMCTVKEMDDETAIIQSFKENVEREEMNPIDEAGWFFSMLGLKEEQLFSPLEKGEGGESLLPPLPTGNNPNVQKLANKLGITPSMIDRRLPLLALSSELQDLTVRTFLGETDEREIPLVPTKAEAIARLRLIGNKEDAQKEMLSAWKKWGKEDAEYIDTQVTKILETYAENADAVLDELKTTEKSLENRVADLNTWVEKDVGDWLNPKSKESVFASLPDELKDPKKGGVDVPALRKKGESENDRDYAQDAYDDLDEFVMTLTKNDLLEDASDKMEGKIEKLKIGKKELDDSECAYCGSEMREAEIQKRIDGLLDDIDDAKDKIKAKDKVRNMTEKVKRELGALIRKYDDVSSTYLASLDKLVKAKKLKEDDYKEKLKKFKLKG